MGQRVITYFSGTGGTKLIAETLRNQLDMVDGIFSIEQDAKMGMMIDAIRCSKTLFLLYPVHAFSAPQIVIDFLEELSEESLKETDVCVISVSGGGAVWPNTKSRVEVISRLLEMGATVIHESMMVMPSNWLLATNRDASALLIRGVPLRIRQIISEIEQRKPRVIKARKIGCLLGRINKLEKKGATRFSKRFNILDHCTYCGWCEEACPRKNIHVDAEEKTIIFGDQCMMCMRCVYGCPQNAITTKSRQVLKDGYIIEDFIDLSVTPTMDVINNSTKGLLWGGVKQYLKLIYFGVSK